MQTGMPVSESSMRPRVRNGLIVGAIGLVINIFVSALVGVCGPLVSLVGGGLAGYLTASQEKLPTKSSGASAGAISGAIAGGLILIGQILGALASLAFFQITGTRVPFGEIPSTGAGLVPTLTYYLVGSGTGFCIGLVGAILAALLGAGAAYVATPEQPQIFQGPPPQ